MIYSSYESELMQRIYALEEVVDDQEGYIESLEQRAEALESALETAYYIVKEDAPRRLMRLRALEPIVRELFPR